MSEFTLAILNEQGATVDTYEGVRLGDTHSECNVFGRAMLDWMRRTINKALANPECVKDVQTYSLAEVRNGTGWSKGARFMLVQEAKS